ncbi:MAG TPA: ABC transporter substrate-binding protein [Anaeromyxobacteraceae bacterium]|nr:ABC transporter substrate-binding protein [Anaeromyxobacteraceae bacterium]
MTRLVRTVSAFAALALAASASAQQEVRIGVIYPLTGAAASTGLELKNAAQLAADLINGNDKSLALPLAGAGGIPNLKGAKIRLIFADHQGNPQVGATEAERLIAEEKVVALQGAYFSTVTTTASQVAERNGVPFLNADSSSPALTQRGFKWFFRTTPHDELFVQNAFEFLRDLGKKKGIQVKRIAILAENTEFGTLAARLQEKGARENGYEVVEKVLYPPKGTQLTSEVQKLKASRPDVVMQSSYLGDAILSMKTYKDLGFQPAAILANDAGFNDSEFLKTMGKDGNFVISREVWALDLAAQKPIIAKANALLQARHGVNFNGNSARAFTGIFALADALNRAGSTRPEAIQKALRETNLSGAQLIMPWSGIQFDENGQNTKGAGIIVQVQDGKYATVWPFALAPKDVVWPMPGWDKR